MGEGNFDALLVKADLEIFLDGVLQSQKVGLRCPDGEEKINGRLAEARQDHLRRRFLEAQRVILRDVHQGGPYPGDVLPVADAEMNVEAPDGKPGGVGQPVLDDRFVGDPDEAVVIGSQLDGEHIDGEDPTAHTIHRDIVVDDKGSFHHDEDAADDVGNAGLGGETDGNAHDAHRAEQGVEMKTQFVEDGKKDDEKAGIINDFSGHHPGLRRKAQGHDFADPFAEIINSG